MKDLSGKIVLLDLECTSWEGAASRGWSGPGEYRELVQFGAVLADTKNFTEISSFATLVKPRLNPELSEYFINLTHITQEEVDRQGVDFSVCLEDFRHWSCGIRQFYCFDNKAGRLFDLDVLLENCDLCGIEFPFDPADFSNINEIFWKYGYDIKQSGSSPAAFGLEIPARPHNALNDTRGLLTALKELNKRVS